MPLIDRLSDLLRKIELFIGCSVGFKYAKNASAPDPIRGAHDAPPVPDLLVGWEGTPVPMPQPPQRRSLGANALRSLWPPWKPGATR